MKKKTASRDPSPVPFVNKQRKNEKLVERNDRIIQFFMPENEKKN